MAGTVPNAVDPRIRRTRQRLQESLSKLLEIKEFDEISVQHIAGTATVNRATFYEHYPDKFALLECIVGSRFCALLAEPGVRFDGTCSSALRATVLALCDYLMSMPRVDCIRPLEPHLESAIIAVVRRRILEGIGQRAPRGAISPEILAAT